MDTPARAGRCDDDAPELALYDEWERERDGGRECGGEWDSDSYSGEPLDSSLERAGATPDRPFSASMERTEYVLEGANYVQTSERRHGLNE